MSIKLSIALEEGQAMPDVDPAAVAELLATETEAQALVSVDDEADFQALDQAEDEADASQLEVASTVDASTALEALASALGRGIAAGDMSQHSVRFANLAIESVSASYGLKTDTLAISFENYQRDPQGALKAAMEDMQMRSESLWASVKEKLVHMAELLVTKLTSFRKNIARLEQRASRVEALISQIDAKQPMRFGVLKPQDWFLDLCYRSKTAPKGLVGIGPAVERLLKESSQVMTASIGRYNDWLKANHVKAAQDATAFNSLRYRTRDFLVLNQRPFSDQRRVVFAKPEADCSFYRSEELPGGMAFYTHCASADQTGVGAITALNQVNYRMAQYDPISYNLAKGAILAAASVATNVFISLAVAAGAAVPFVAATILSRGSTLAGKAVIQAARGVNSALTGAADAVLHTDRAYERDAQGQAYGSKIKLTKDMLFETLSLAEAKRVLGEVRDGVIAMKAWETTVFREVYKDKEAGDLIQKLLDTARGSKASGASVRLLKNLCFAVFNLQTGMSNKTLSYSIRTYSSMLNYVQKSSYQYR